MSHLDDLQYEAFYQKYSAGRNRADFRRDCNAFFGGLAAIDNGAGNSHSKSMDRSAYLRNVASIK